MQPESRFVALLLSWKRRDGVCSILKPRLCRASFAAADVCTVMRALSQKSLLTTALFSSSPWSVPLGGHPEAIVSVLCPGMFPCLRRAISWVKLAMACSCKAFRNTNV